MAPDRVPYRFDTHTWLRERITADSVGVDSTVRPQQLSRPSSKGALEHARPASGAE
jgi:hypothetical protein